MHFAHLANILLKDEESARDNHIFACNFAKIFTGFNFVFTLRLHKKPFLILLLRTAPHLQYGATLPGNLSLMACFVDINVSQSSVTTYAKCGGILNMHLTAN